MNRRQHLLGRRIDPSVKPRTRSPAPAEQILSSLSGVKTARNWLLLKVAEVASTARTTELSFGAAVDSIDRSSGQ